MEDVEEHRFYLPGAAEPHFQVHERRVARFEVAERIGGGGDLVGLRSKPPFIGGTSEGKRSVHFLLSTQKRGAARAAPKLKAARGLGGLGGAAYCKRIGTSAWARRSVRGGLTSTYILFTLAAMVENVIKTAGPTWQSRPSRRACSVWRFFAPTPASTGSRRMRGEGEGLGSALLSSSSKGAIFRGDGRWLCWLEGRRWRVPGRSRPTLGLPLSCPG